MLEGLSLCCEPISCILRGVMRRWESQRTQERGEMEEEEWPTRGKANERRDVYVRERHTQGLDTEKSERGGIN